jgi:cyclophilin family peptidyl-prolyl cis-trans isomerase
VIAVPAAEVADVVRACAAKRVRGLVVVSGGFATPARGRARLEEVVRLARTGGMRLIGPNAMGVVNTDPAVRLHATFAGGAPPVGPGRACCRSPARWPAPSSPRRSGARSGCRPSCRSATAPTSPATTCSSTGRPTRAPRWWCCTCRGFGNPRKFARIARRLGRTKPVVALKSGHGAGDVAVDALFASAGVVRVRSLGQLFTTAQLFALQPLPQGRRVGVVGNSTALGSMAADALREHDLLVPELTAATCERLHAIDGVTGRGPVDLGPYAGGPELAAALDIVLGSGEVDAVLAVVVPPPHGRDRERVAGELGAVLRTAAGGPLPVLASFLGVEGVPPALAVTGEEGAPARGSVPSYASPESAALALSRVVGYAEWRARPEGEVQDLPGTDVRAARAALSGLPADGSWLSQEQARAVLGCVGIAVQPSSGSPTRMPRWPPPSGWAGRWSSRRPTSAGATASTRARCAWRWPARTTCGRRGATCSGPPARVRPSCSRWPARRLHRGAAGAGPVRRAAAVAAPRRRGGRPARRPGHPNAAADRTSTQRLVRGIRGHQLLTGEASGEPVDVAALEELLQRVAVLGRGPGPRSPSWSWTRCWCSVRRGRAARRRAAAARRHDPERGPRRLGTLLRRAVAGSGVTSPAQPPGWYPDPTGQPQSRYWDGIQWTSSTQFAGRPVARAGRSTGLVVGLALGAVLTVVALGVGGVVLLRGALSDSSSGPSATATDQGFPGQIPRATPRVATQVGPCTYTPEGAPSRPVEPPTEADLATSGTFEVILETSVGRVAFEVAAARTPCALTSLRALARAGYFDDTPCHRLTTAGISVLQCGDPDGAGSGGPGYSFADEALEQATYPRGTVAMANRGPDTNGSQFFLVYADTALPPDYTPLGRITQGLEVVEKVAAAGSDDSNGPGDGAPRTPVQIERLTVAPR